MCCVAPAFEVSEDFAVDKEAGVPCRHLGRDCRCAIHDELVVRGFLGCSVYDCYGAGPRVTRLFEGAAGSEEQRDEAFLILRVVHEMLWLLTEAAKLCSAVNDELGAEIRAEVAVLDMIAQVPPPALFDIDMHGCRDRAHRLLWRTGEAVGGRSRRALVVVR